MTSVQNLYECTYQLKKITLAAGIYRLEVWGASGGRRGGKGGYSTGELSLNKETDVYIHVGCTGSDLYTGYNGGGAGSDCDSGSGGGATDIRLKTDDLLSRIIVAGGGGGGGDRSGKFGGFGGGLTGGDGEYDSSSGKGASQTTETVGCKTSGTCATGTFGVGANGGSGAGGGWFGGSASYEGSGGGSGYVLTSKSFKPSGYLLNDSIYFLKNAETIGGNESFPSPTSSAYETGHNGNGYARITTLLPESTIFPTLFATAMATMKATMVGIKPALRFNFTSTKGSIISDKTGMFKFSPQDTFKSTVSPGKFHFYANGSSCGQSIFAHSSIFTKTPMEITMANDVMIKLNMENFIIATSSNSPNNAYISSKAKADFNITMSDYDCEQTGQSSLLITYQPFSRFSCRNNDLLDMIEIFTMMLLITTKG